MMFGGVVALVYGVDAEGKGLEDIAEPLTKADRDRPASARLRFRRSRAVQE